jgi:hypothetical protein
MKFNEKETHENVGNDRIDDEAIKYTTINWLITSHRSKTRELTHYLEWKKEMAQDGYCKER